VYFVNFFPHAALILNQICPNRVSRFRFAIQATPIHNRNGGRPTTGGAVDNSNRPWPLTLVSTGLSAENPFA